MSKPISDAQIYMLLWARSCTYGAFSELHAPPLLIELPDRRRIRLGKTACDRLGLLGLGRRGLMRDINHGLWEITDAGRAELMRPAIMKRIAAMVEATEADARATQAEQAAHAEMLVGSGEEAYATESAPLPVGPQMADAQPRLQSGDTLYHVRECDPPDDELHTWQVESELVKQVRVDGFRFERLVGFGHTHKWQTLDTRYHRTPDAAVTAFIKAKHDEIESAYNKITEAERAIVWANSLGNKSEQCNAHAAPAPKVKMCKRCKLAAPAPKVKMCKRCKLAGRKAVFTCRACRATCCEHLCGLKAGREATCGKCYR